MMNKRIKFCLQGTIAIAWVMACPGIVAACPTCKFGLHDATALGYAISILFMMAMPFLIFSFWAVTIYRLRKKHL